MAAEVKKRYGFRGEVLPEGVYTIPPIYSSSGRKPELCQSQYYYICFSINNLPRVRHVCKGVQNVGAAVAIRIAEMAEMQNVNYDLAKKQMGLFAAMKEYEELYPAQRTHKISFDVWRTYFKHDMGLHEIKANKIARFRQWRETHSENPGVKVIEHTTINRDLAILRRLLNWAIAYYELKLENPFKNRAVIEFTDEGPNQVERYLSLEEINQLFTAPSMKGKLRQLCYFAMNCYMRQGQILSRKWTDIDWQLRRIAIGQSKAKKKPTYVNLNEDIIQMLMSMPRDSEYIFGHEGWDEKLKDDPKARLWWHYRTAFETTLRQAKIENFNFHCFRHTAATYTAAATGDLGALQKLLNHASITTTMRYAHIIDAARERAARELGNVYNKVVSLGSLCQMDVKPLKELIMEEQGVIDKSIVSGS